MKFEEFGSDDELSLLWEHRLPVFKDGTPFIGGSSDNNENLYVYLDPINSDQMQDRFGKEKVVKEFDNIIVTLGRFKGGRYIYRNEKGEYVGVINYTKIDRNVVISNIYVRPDYRRKNIASQLVDIIKRDYPKITVDTHMTDLGGKFFGYKDKMDESLDNTKKIKSVFNSIKSKIYDVVFSATDSGPFDGGCVFFAKALQKAIGGELISLISARNGQADHACVSLGGFFIDFDGALPPDKFIKRFEKNELVKISGHRAFNESDLPDAPRGDSKSIMELASLIKSTIDNKSQIQKESIEFMFENENIPDILDGKPTKNSLGQLIHPTEEGIRNFWRWFGNSKTVDANGRPIVCYHATSANFSVINMKKGTQGFFWFTSNLSEIEDQSIGASGYDRVMNLYIKMERPADWDAYDRLMTFQIKRDYDGTMLVDPDGTFSGFIFEPTQVKSTKNKGTFSPDVKKITM